jgi:hypothetical protein
MTTHNHVIKLFACGFRARRISHRFGFLNYREFKTTTASPRFSSLNREDDQDQFWYVSAS